jgi:hypothetical protein
VVRGAWCVVRGAWCVVRGAWCVVRGAWCVVRVLSADVKTMSMIISIFQKNVKPLSSLQEKKFTTEDQSNTEETGFVTKTPRNSVVFLNHYISGFSPISLKTLALSQHIR